jgi:hypothetical protein
VHRGVDGLGSHLRDEDAIEDASSNASRSSVKKFSNQEYDDDVSDARLPVTHN